MYFKRGIFIKSYSTPYLRLSQLFYLFVCNALQSTRIRLLIMSFFSISLNTYQMLHDYLIVTNILSLTIILAFHFIS